MKFLHYSFLFLLLPLLFACENEPVGDKVDVSQAIPVESELYDLIQKVAGNEFDNDIACIDFRYAFTLLIFDEGLSLIDEVIVANDLEFSLLLGSLEYGKSISLSYPITGTNENGETFTINNNEELKQAIDQCRQFDTKTTFGNIITESCVWRVSHLDGPNDQYDNSYYDVAPLGTVGLNYDGDSYGGTWVTYFIEDELHLNIFLTGDETISNDWNYDWKVIDFSATEMEIENGIDTIRLVKKCLESCISFVFEECETEQRSNTAIFNLESYFSCFFAYSGIQDVSTTTWSYYETIMDCYDGTNPIADPTAYMNIENPQRVYVRFDDVNTGELITVVPIVLKAIACQ